MFGAIKAQDESNLALHTQISGDKQQSIEKLSQVSIVTKSNTRSVSKKRLTRNETSADRNSKSKSPKNHRFGKDAKSTRYLNEDRSMNGYKMIGLKAVLNSNASYQQVGLSSVELVSNQSVQEKGFGIIDPRDPNMMLIDTNS